MAEKSRKSLADSLLKSVKKATRKDETVYSSKPSKSLVDKPKYTQGQGLGDVELRADLEAYMYGNPLARLGYELYKEGKINIKGIDRLIMPGMLTTPATAKEFGLGDKTTLLYRTEPGSGQHMEKRPYGPLREINQVENEMAEANIDPLKVIIHELTHAGFSALEEKTGKKVGVEEGIVRAGDELITARTTGRPGTLGGPGLKNLLGGSNIPFTPNNEKILKERYLKYSLQAQDLLNEKGIPQEAIAPSDNRNPAFISKTFKELLGFEKERNKLNHLGFARPLEDYYLGLPTKQHGALYTKDVSSFGDDAIKKGTLDPSRADLMVEGPTYLPRNKKIKMQEGGALMALQEQAGLGTSPMTQKTSPPVGNKKQKVEKMPKRGAAPKVVDPRDEVMKLVAKKLKQDKTNVGIATPTAPMPTAMPSPMTTALAAPQIPAKKAEEEQLLSPTPIKAAKGKSIEDAGKSKKKGKGLAVVIDMGSTEKPEYEEASMGTPSDPPPGATADEVKDNQHVLLSEGELVVPANVVRYHGLGMYEGLRRDALQGLGEMEDAGQVEYIDNEVKTAAAGMTIMNAQPNVATLGGIQKQQAVYNPALGQYGTAKAPEAASAKFVQTPGFIDKNKDGIDDKLQPSINKGIASPVSSTGTITPAALNLGPTTNPNTVVGAGNVGSYVANQSGIPGSGGDTTPPAVETPQAPLVRRPVQQEENNDNPVETEQEKAARALANEKINKAKELGYTYSPMKQIAMALLPLGFLGVNQKVGTVTLAGNVVGNDGREYDPLTGKVASSGSMITDISNKLQGKDISNIGPGGEIVPDTKDPIGFTPMTAAGLVQYTLGEMRKAIGEEQLVNQVNAEVDKLQKENTTSLVAPEAPSLKVNSMEELMQKINAGVKDDSLIDTNYQAAQKIGGEQQGIRSPSFKSSTTPLAQEITGTGSVDQTGRFLSQAEALSGVSRDTIEADPNYQSSRKSFENLSIQELNNILDGTIASTVAQKTAAQDLKEERLLTRVSSPYFGNAPGSEMTPERSRQIQQESDFDVEETFGSGRKSQRDSALDTFNDDAKSDIESRGGTKSVGLNDNGSFYSENNDGSFTHEDGTSVNFTDSSGKPGNPPSDESISGAPSKGTPADQGLGSINTDNPGGDPSGGKSIVCTEMYRQTQLDDWSQAMKTWYIYQKKYLTPIHEIGYHWLFKPFVRGMKVNRALTNLGAYLAKERTKHLRHILTKGKAQDSIIGNVFCKIIHPIVYLVGLAVHKK